MIPIRDEMPTRRFPIVNYLLIAVNVIVFILQLLSGPAQESLIYQFALIPQHFQVGFTLGDITDVFTSMFMHGGWLHLGGNMLYLWIFGDNVEDSMGSIKYLAFYMFGGIIASLTHILTNPSSTIPTVGASGAIASVLGAYLVLFPRARVLTFIPLGYFMRLTLIPASIVLGLWFVLQLVEGFISFGGPDVGGVAIWAHVGGFLTGVVLGRLLVGSRNQQSGVHW